MASYGTGFEAASDRFDSVQDAWADLRRTLARRPRDEDRYDWDDRDD
jgi:hypothetical protein